MNERTPGNLPGTLSNDAVQSATPKTTQPPHRPWAPNISNTLKPPVLPNVNPRSISQEQAYSGIAVHIPGSPLMEEGDTIVFNWGLHQSSTRILHTIGFSKVARVLCIAYGLITPVQYGLVDVYFEVLRRGKRIGTSPALLVTVNRDLPKRAPQRDADS